MEMEESIVSVICGIPWISTAASYRIRVFLANYGGPINMKMNQ